MTRTALAPPRQPDTAAVDLADAEPTRIAALRSFGVLDTDPEAAFDDLTALAAQLCGTSMAAVSLVDADRQWLKSALGMERCEVSRGISLCAYALGSTDVMVVPDARRDPRFADNPMVTGQPHLRFYAGAPLLTPSGHVLGTLCVFDEAPGSLGARQREQLRTLARQVVSQLVLRRQARELAEQVSARRQAELALRDSGRLLDDLLSHTDVVVYAKDLDGRFLVANPALHALLQQPDGQVLGRTDRDLFPAEEAEEFGRNDREIAVTGRRHVFTEQLLHPDGTAHDFLSTKFPLRDTTGTVYAVAGVSSDVTELAAERAAHAEAEERWKALVEHSPVGVLVVDVSGRFRYANPRAHELLGVPPEQGLQGRDMADFQPEGGRDSRGALFAAVAPGGPAVHDRRWPVRRADGVVLTTEVNASSVHHQGRPAIQLEIRDVTDRVRAEQQLREAHDELEARKAFTDAVLDSIDVGIVACDASGTLTLFNDTSRAWHGLDLDAQARRPEDLPQTFNLHQVDGTPLTLARIPLLRALREGAVHDAEVLISPAGRPATRVSCSGRALTARDGRPLGAVVAMTDVTAVRAQTRALQASEQRFRTTFDNDPAGLAVLGPDGAALQVNLALCRLLGRGTTELLALPDLLWAVAGEQHDVLRAHADAALQQPGASWSSEAPLRRVDGRELWALLTLTDLSDPEAGSSRLLQVEDVTARRDAERRLTHEARFDSLTDLPNRLALLEHAERLLARSAHDPSASPLALLFCDLDGFKAVNDCFGHAAGDRVLVEVAARLRQAVRPGDVVARLGGDEFVVLCELRTMADVDAVARRIAGTVQQPVVWGEQALSVTASIGVAHAMPDLAAEELLRRADAAMYEAKRRGKDCYAQYGDGLAA